MVATFVGCNQGLTLQTYFVDNELKPGFTSLDVPTSFLDIKKADLTKEQIEAYESVDKLNMLGFIATDENSDQIDEEVAKITGILKDPKYDELIRGGNVTDGKFMVKFIGDPESLDELILFGYARDRGFAVVRVLGDDMNANQLVQLFTSVQKKGISNDDIGQFLNFFN